MSSKQGKTFLSSDLGALTPDELHEIEIFALWLPYPMAVDFFRLYTGFSADCCEAWASYLVVKHPNSPLARKPVSFDAKIYKPIPR